jgi:peptidoglycan/xylan/chitin deacetylase (PgdA/CDA1 family)
MLKTDCPASWFKPHWRIMCYHAIPDGFTDAFRAQLVAFREMGFEFVGLEEGLESLTEAKGFNRPIMTITFDDGDRRIYENALPVLEEVHVRAFLYVTADYIRKGTTYRDEDPSPAMTWQQLRDWLKARHGIGSHTLTHAPLRLCNDTRLTQECSLSKKILEDNLQTPIHHLSYPWGQHSKRTYELLLANGLYESAATIDRGSMYPQHDPYKLRRDVCNPRIPIESMQRLMRMADYFYWLRHFRKKPEGYWERHPELKWNALEGLAE